MDHTVSHCLHVWVLLNSETIGKKCSLIENCLPTITPLEWTYYTHFQFHVCICELYYSDFASFRF